jgi:hypothetical protein
MARHLAKVCLLGSLVTAFLFTTPSADSQTQLRNFNLNCGLIGKFARYPQHLQHCRALAVCADPQFCLRKKAGKRKLQALQLALTPPEEVDQSEPGVDGPGETDPNTPGTPDPGDTNSDGLGARASAEGGVQAGGSSAGAKGSASVGSGSGDSAGASAGAGTSGGGLNVSGGGSISVGGL